MEVKPILNGCCCNSCKQVFLEETDSILESLFVHVAGVTVAAVCVEDI